MALLAIVLRKLARKQFNTSFSFRLYNSACCLPLNLAVLYNRTRHYYLETEEWVLTYEKDR